LDKVISEIIIGAVILTLLISIIPAYRNSAELVSSAGEKMDVNENIKEVTIGRLPAVGDIGSGRYLLELMEYLAKRYYIQISVRFSKGTYLFTNSTYEKAYDVIKNDMLFELSNVKKATKVIKIKFVYLESTGDQ